jgi:hypothetical protein
VIGEYIGYMENKIKGFGDFLLEYYNSVAPGSVVVPGEWYKDNVNSRNYRPAYTQLPDVVDSMFQTTDLYNYLDDLSEEEELNKLIKEGKNAKEIIKYVKKRIHEELLPQQRK